MLKEVILFQINFCFLGAGKKTPQKNITPLWYEQTDSQQFPVQSAGRFGLSAAAACCSAAAGPSAPLSAGGAALSTPAA